LQSASPLFLSAGGGRSARRRNAEGGFSDRALDMPSQDGRHFSILNPTARLCAKIHPAASEHQALGRIVCMCQLASKRLRAIRANARCKNSHPSMSADCLAFIKTRISPQPCCQRLKVA